MRQAWKVGKRQGAKIIGQRTMSWVVAVGGRRSGAVQLVLLVLVLVLVLMAVGVPMGVLVFVAIRVPAGVLVGVGLGGVAGRSYLRIVP